MLKNKSAYFQIFDIVINEKIADFADFAAKYGTSYKELKDLNPWLRESYLTNAGNKTYTIKLPESSREFVNSDDDKSKHGVIN